MLWAWGQACLGLRTMGGGVTGHLLLCLSLCLQLLLPPSLPQLPSPRGIVANTAPPHPPPTGALGIPSLPGHLWGGSNTGAGCGMCALPRQKGPQCISASHGPITLYIPLMGNPNFFEKLRPQSGQGWSPSLCDPSLAFLGTQGAGLHLAA